MRHYKQIHQWLLVVAGLFGMDGKIEKLVIIQFLQLKFKYYNVVIYSKMVIVVKKMFVLEVIYVLIIYKWLEFQLKVNINMFFFEKS